MVTVALGTAAPFTSNTCPAMEPPVACACAAPGGIRMSARAVSVAASKLLNIGFDLQTFLLKRFYECLRGEALRGTRRPPIATRPTSWTGVRAPRPAAVDGCNTHA